MKPILPLLILAASLSACAPLARQEPPPEVAPVQRADSERETEKAEAEAQAQAQARLPNVTLTPKLLYGLLLAEIAGQRGQAEDSALIYLDLATETRDPRIARRATEIALHGRRLDTALQAARIWQETDPEAVPARQAMLGLLAASGQYDELKQVLPAFLAAEPLAIRRNLLQLSRLFARGGDRQAVRDIVDAVTAPYLHLPEAHFARAQAAYETRDLPAARAAIGRALELKPDWENAALMRAQLTEDRNEALMSLGFFVAANPRASDARLAYARALAGEKRYEEARREFGVLLSQSAGDPAKQGDIVFALAVLSLQINDTDEAEKHLRRLVDIGHAESDKARYFLGQIAADGKRGDEALKWFESVGRGEHYLNARLQVANLLAKQGQIEAARQYLHAVETATPRERAQLLIGEAQLLREAGRLADAHATLVAALAQDPDQPELIYETALLAERLGQVNELETRLRRLLELKPDHAHALNALGFSLADRNIRLDEARDLIDQALALAPNDPFILDSKGWVLFRRGDAHGALETLQRAFSIRADPEIAAHIGEVLWSLGRRDEARQTWDKARKEHPDNEALAETIKRLAP